MAEFISNKLSAVRKLLDDLEREIYEINAEQGFLIYRLRKSLDDFYKSLPVNNIIIDRDADNTFLRHTFSKYVDDPNYPCEAITVKTRKSFNQWKKKFSLDDPKRILNVKNPVLNNATKINFSSCNGNSNANVNGLPQKQRVSLLKPKCERDLTNLNDSNQSLDIKNEDDSLSNENDKIILNNDTTNTVLENDEKPELKIESKVEDQSSIALKPSPAMNIGRMKLLQALNKAKNQKDTPTSQSPASTGKAVAAAIKITQKSPEQQKNSKYADVLSSSDDSLDGINALPPIEPEKQEISEINQEMFLRQFGLYTLQHSAYLKQRRSKRRRRNVQFNERKDFHYGTLNFAAIDAQTATYPKEKKKKIFLVSPTISRRAAKRRRSAKDEIINNKNNKSDRSSMSSPDEKLFCNVCFRNNELLVLNRCKKCKQNYHTSCHSKIYFNTTKKICPVCLRAKKTSRSASSEDFTRENNGNRSKSGENKIRRSSLIDRCNELKQKYATAQIHQNNLLKESEAYKTKMNELFNIVDTIKNQQTDNEETTPETVVFSIEISDEDGEVMENDDMDSSEKDSQLSVNFQENSEKEQINQVILPQTNDGKDHDHDKSNGTDSSCEPVDSDEEILVIKEDANVVEIEDALEAVDSDDIAMAE
ncbi:uncharacterized protein LOC129613115 isoform X2 [Condylostylus longicornis]|uniref:uncharacterized protein LOC129613115 isoform X2 n=1 Tax=Condylostylus longicornis TaxID=2530218 RepID=UPI00244E0FA3|nr:uncharacterized protein LOC129613115 isoform X2 [Condylostylus longicornis]